MRCGTISVFSKKSTSILSNQGTSFDFNSTADLLHLFFVFLNAVCDGVVLLAVDDGTANDLIRDARAISSDSFDIDVFRAIGGNC